MVKYNVNGKAYISMEFTEWVEHVEPVHVHNCGVNCQLAPTQTG